MPPATTNENDTLQKNKLSLQLPTRADSKASCTRQQSDSLEENSKRQSALQQATKQEEEMSRELQRVSSLDDTSDSDTSTITSADSPSHLSKSPFQLKNDGCKDVTSALQGEP